MRRGTRHHTLLVLALVAFALLCSPVRALALFSVEIGASNEGGAVYVYDEDEASYEEVRYGGPKTFGPYSNYASVQLPPAKIRAVPDPGYHAKSWAWNGSNRLPESSVSLTYTISAGQLGSTRGSNGHVTVTFAENASTVTFYGNAPDGLAATGVPSPVTVSVGDAAERGLPSDVPACPGYVFLGWNTASDGGGEAYESFAGLYRLLRQARDNSNRSVRLYAQWAPAPRAYTVRYEGGADGVAGVPGDQGAVVGSPAALAAAPSRDGWLFAGWVGPDGVVVTSTSQLDAYAEGGADQVVVTAAWLKTYDVRLYSSAASPDPVATLRGVVEGEGRALPVPERRGYEFAGWVPRTSPGTRALTTADLDAVAEAGGSVEAEPAWVGLPYLVVYDAAGGVGSVPDQPARVGVDAALDDGSALSLEGHEFAGWAAAVDGEGVVVSGTGQLDPLVSSAGQAVVVSARWAEVVAPSYSIRFLGGAGGDAVSGMPGADQEVAIGSGPVALAEGVVPERAGWVFAGWALGGVPVATTADVELALGGVSAGQVVEVEAAWKMTYRVELDAAGGSVSPASLTVVVGESQDLPMPERAGHRFDGWWLGEGDDAVTVSSTSLLDASARPGGVVAIAARWTRAYRVELDAAGGMVSPASLAVMVGEGQELPTPVWAGHRFEGWWLVMDSSVRRVVSTLDIDASATPGADVVVTARWTVLYHVVLNSGGGSVQPVALDVVAGEPQDLPVPTRADYRFDGWWLGGEQVTSTRELDRGASPDATMILVAHWAKTYHVELLAEVGSSEVLARMDVVAGESQELPVPERRGYEFAGWMPKEGENPSFVRTTASLDDLVGAGGTVRLLPSWNGLPYVIDFDLDGGIGVMESQVATVGVDAPLASGSHLSRAGYLFYHWTIDVPDASTTVSHTSELDSLVEAAGQHVIVRAAWIEHVVTYTVRFETHLDEAASAMPDPVKVSLDGSFGDSLDLSSLAPTCDGWAFAGWVLLDDPAQSRIEFLSDIARFMAPSEGDVVTLLATWHKCYTLKLEDDALEQSTQMEVVAGEEQYLPTPARENYRFGGWVLEDDDKTMPVTSSTDVDAIAKPGDTLVAHASWRKTYTVLLDTRDDVGDSEQLAIVEGDDVVFPVPSREDSLFSGWNTVPDGSGAVALNSATTDEFARPGDTVVLYAQWRSTAPAPSNVDPTRNDVEPSTALYTADRSARRRVVPATLGEVIAANSPTIDRVYPSVGGKVAEIGIGDASGGSTGGESGPDDLVAVDGGIPVQTRNGWIGAGTMAVAGSTALIGLMAAGGVLGNGAAAAGSAGAGAAASAAGARQGVGSALRRLLGLLRGR